MDSRHLDVLWRQNPIFRDVSASDLARIRDAFPSVDYPSKTLIAGTGTPCGALHVLLSGTVRVFHRTLDGREVTVKLLRAPNVFGEIELFHDLDWLECVEALDDVVIAKIPKSDYLDFLMAHPRATLEQLIHVTAAFCVAARNEQHVFSPLEQRIANLILTFADLYGNEESGVTTIMYPLSQTDIAKSLNATRRSVAEIISLWVKQEVLEKKKDSYAIKNATKLETIAAPIRDSLRYEMGMSLKPLNRVQVKARAEVRVLSGSASLRDRRYPVDRDLIVGRAPPSTLLLPDETVSPQHCRIFQAATGGRYWIEDLKSLNGTLIDGKAITRAVLHHGDTIQVGWTTLAISITSAD